MVNHIHKENHILFPLVQKFLTKDALREIARRMTAPGTKI
jgi:iron-sulfur cluster repair protein YtfE (RIC family)